MIIFNENTCSSSHLVIFFPMNIILNGNHHTTQAPTITALTLELGLNMRQVAVEKNLAIIPKSQHESTPIVEGDRVEILAFVGGG